MATKLIFHFDDNDNSHCEMDFSLIDIIKSDVNYIYINDILFYGMRYEIKYEGNLVTYTCEDGRKSEYYYNPQDGCLVLYNYFKNGDCFIYNYVFSYNQDGNIVINDYDKKYISINPSFTTTIKDIDSYDIDGESLTFDEDYYISYIGYKINFHALSAWLGLKEIEKFNPESESDLLITEIAKNNKLNDSTKAVLWSVAPILQNPIYSSDGNAFTRVSSNILSFTKDKLPILYKMSHLRNHDFSEEILFDDEVEYLNSVLEDSFKYIESNSGVAKTKK